MKVYVLWRYVHDFGEEPEKEIKGIFLTEEEAKKASENMMCDIEEIITGRIIQD